MGLYTSAGTSVATALGSALLGLKFFEELPSRDAAGQPMIGGRTPLDLDTCEGANRLVALAVPALQECAGASPPAPLLLCLPEPAQRFDPAAVTARISRDAGPAVDPAHSRFIIGGRCAVFAALERAAELLGAGAARDVYVGGVDSLIDREPLDTLMRAGRLRTSTTDGFVPGEGAGFLRLRLRADRDTRALIAGVARAHEAASGDADQSSPPPSSGAALAHAAASALGAAGQPVDAASAFVHSASGDRAGFREPALALTRLRPRAEPPISVWTPASSAGELGTAYGPFALALGAHFLHKNVTPGPALVVFAAADDDGHDHDRYAAVLAKPPAYAPSRR